MGSECGPRVLFLDQTGQLGGAELCLLDLVTRRPAGDRVALFDDGPFAAALTDAGTEVSVLPWRSAGNVRKSSGMLRSAGAAADVWSQAGRVARLAAGYDVLYANTAKALVVAAVSTLRRRRPLVYHLHDIVTADHFSVANRRLMVGLANRRAAAVIANSQATADAFVAAGGSRRLVTVIPNGFEPAVYDPANVDPLAVQQLRRELSPDGAPLIALFGRLAPWKGQLLAIDAVAKLTGARLALVGDALFGEDDYARSVSRRAEEADVAGRVHLLGFRMDVPLLMQAADVVLHASTAPEPFGRVIIEGMLSGKPVVAARAGGAAEIVESGRTGWLFEPGSPDRLAEVVAAVLADSVGSRRIAEAGRRDAEERFHIDAIVSATNRVIAAAAGNS